MSDDHAHGTPDYEPEGEFEFSNGKLGMWLFIVSDAMAFVGFLGAYMILRMSAELDVDALSWMPSWAPKLDVFLTGINTFVLIFSSVTMVKALQAIQDGNLKRFRAFLLATMLGGTFFVGFQCFEWTHFIHSGITIQGLRVPHLDEAMERADSKGIEITRLAMAERLYGRRDVSDLDTDGKFTDVEFLECDLVMLTDIEDDTRPKKPGVIHRADFGVAKEGYTRKEDGQFVSEITRDYLTAADLQDMEPQEILDSRAKVSSGFSSSFFLLTGFHGFHVLLGVLYMGVLLALSFKGRFDENNNSPIELAGLYWHFVDLVWVLLFMVIYLI